MKKKEEEEEHIHTHTQEEETNWIKATLTPSTQSQLKRKYKNVKSEEWTEIDRLTTQIIYTKI